MSVFWPSLPLSKEDAAKYPRHGWARHGDITFHLFPIVRVLREAKAVRQGLGAAEPSRGFDTVWADAFGSTLEHSLVALRELALIALNPPTITLPGEEATGEELAANLDKRIAHTELAPVLIDSGFVYLSRLADVLVTALDPILFRKTGQIENRMRTFRTRMANPEKLARLEPIVADPSRLATLFQDDARMKWLDLLKGDSGYRDVMVHGARQRFITWVRTSSFGANEKDPPAQLVAWPLIKREQGDTSEGMGELVAGLRECYFGFCDFLTELHIIIGWGDGYTSQDWIGISGEHAASAHFWPPL